MIEITALILMFALFCLSLAFPLELLKKLFKKDKDTPWREIWVAGGLSVAIWAFFWVVYCWSEIFGDDWCS